jgi:hypothetical protein
MPWRRFLRLQRATITGKEIRDLKAARPMTTKFLLALAATEAARNDGHPWDLRSTWAG